MIAPIKSLTKRISIAVDGISNLRSSIKGCQMGFEEQDKVYRNLQIKLLRDYQKKNKETNILYMQFLMKAKIMFVARAIST